MQKNEKRRAALGVVLISLVILVLISFVLVSGSFMRIGEGAPVASVEIPEFNSPNNENTTSNNVFDSVEDENNLQDYNIYVEDDKQVWSNETTIELFKMAYVGEDGGISVESAYKDMVVAPGTSNKYIFYVRNPGEIPKEYKIKAITEVKAVVNENSVKIPIEARLYNHEGKYLAGTENEFVDIYKFDKVTDKCTLSGEHYAKYTFEWCWPFEGDDELDTFLGNMSAEGDAIAVSIKLVVEATDKPGATGGIPQTGDMTQMGLWIGISISASFMFILLLYLRRKEENEQKNESN